MADEDVKVKFGADTEAALSGVAQVKSAVGGFSDGISELNSKMNELAAAIGVAFSVEGIKHFVTSMADLGESLEKTGATMGLTNQQTVVLSGMANLVGVDVNTLTRGMERLYLSLQRSTRDGMNPAAQALRVLHLTASDLIGLPADQFFEKLTTQIAKFNPSMNLSAALMQLGARQMAMLVGPLSIIGHHYEEFKTQVTAASEGLADAIPAMADTHEKIALLDTAAQSFGARIFTVLKPAIDGVISWMTKWLESMDAAKIKKFSEDAIDYIQTATLDIASFFIGSGATVDDFIAKLDEVTEKAKLIASVGAGGTAGALVGSIFPGIGTAVGAAAGGVAGAITYYTSQWDSSTKDAAAKITADKNTVAAKITDFFTGIKTAVDQGNASIKGVQMTGGLDAAKINENMSEAVSEMKSHYETMIKQVDDFYALEKQHLASSLQLHQITYDQETSKLLENLAEQRAAVDAFYTAEIAVEKAAGKNYEDINKQKIAADDNFAKQHDKIIEDAAKHDEEIWTKAADAVSGAFNSQAQKILTGQESFGKGMEKISGDILLKVIEDQIKLSLEFIAQNALKLTSWIATEAGMTTASTAGAAAREAAQVASGQESILESIANAIKAIYTSVGQTSAAVTAEVAPAVGPAAPAIGAAAGATTLATALSFIKGAEIGGYVVSGGLLNVHSGEEIVPANISQPYAGGGGNNSQSIALNLSAFNSAGLQSLIRQMMPQLARELNAYTQLNPSSQ
jgi:ferritin-like protein